MTFIIDNTEFNINMNDSTVRASSNSREHYYNFSHFNAEDCETAEDVKEMIEEWVAETAA